MRMTAKCVLQEQVLYPSYVLIHYEDVTADYNGLPMAFQLFYPTINVIVIMHTFVC